jgi:hypothetical protein
MWGQSMSIAPVHTNSIWARAQSLHRLDNGTLPFSVSDPDLVGSVFNLGQDPDPYSESGFRIQMSKNRFKKPKFTMTNFKDKNRKML